MNLYERVDALVIIKTRHLQLVAKQRGVKVTRKNFIKLKQAVFRFYVKKPFEYCMYKYFPTDLLRLHLMAPNTWLETIPRDSLYREPRLFVPLNWVSS